jgi:hypothetical protein
MYTYWSLLSEEAIGSERERKRMDFGLNGLERRIIESGIGWLF